MLVALLAASEGVAMTDKLREAAMALVRTVSDGLGGLSRGVHWDPRLDTKFRDLEAALVEPEEPKVERVLLRKGAKADGGGIYIGDRQTGGYEHPGTGTWDLYAERPITAKSKAEELADHLEFHGCTPCKEAAAELRRLRK